MISVVSAVEKIVRDSPFLVRGVELGLFNMSEVARRLQPQIEAGYWKPVRHAAVLMALRRLAARTPRQPRTETDAAAFLCDELTSRPDLIVTAYVNSVRTRACERRLVKLAGSDPAHYLCIRSGVADTLVVVSRPLALLADTAFAGQRQRARFDPVTAFTLHLVAQTRSAPGVYNALLNALAARRVAVVTFHCTVREMTVMVAKADADTAHQVFSRLVSG